MSEKEIDWDALDAELTAKAEARGIVDVSIEVNGEIYREFEYLLTLLKKTENASGLENTTDLINYILSGFADGSRRPGSWERGMLDKMGIVADCEEHRVYRQVYGDPKVTL